MIQKEVAERLTDKPPRMNRLAASVGFWSEPKMLFTVHKGDFSPPPKVDSAAIALTPKKTAGNETSYYSLVRTLFKQPRKTIWNNIKELEIEDLEKKIKEIGINPADRPQNLTVEDIIRISTIL
jgi:16S rRNA (adenine1518-N6/adenine1519-N6)-dimethyltransferase